MEETSGSNAGHEKKIVSLLSIENLSKKFDELTIVENFSLELPEGSFTTLVGPSGCGKSTLFDLLTGSIKPDGGKQHAGECQNT